MRSRVGSFDPKVLTQTQLQAAVKRVPVRVWVTVVNGRIQTIHAPYFPLESLESELVGGSVTTMV